MIRCPKCNAANKGRDTCGACDAVLAPVPQEETDVQFVRRMLSAPNDDLVRLVRLCRREHHVDSGSPEGERLYREVERRSREMSIRFGHTQRGSIDETLRILKLWIPQALPANAQGKVPFARALVDSAIEEIEGLLDTGDIR